MIVTRSPTCRPLGVEVTRGGEKGSRGKCRIRQRSHGQRVSRQARAAAIERPLIDRRAIGKRRRTRCPTRIAGRVDIGIRPICGQATSGISHDNATAVDSDVNTSEYVRIGGKSLQQAAPLMSGIVQLCPGRPTIVGTVDAEKTADRAEDINRGIRLPRRRAASAITPLVDVSEAGETFVNVAPKFVE